MDIQEFVPGVKDLGIEAYPREEPQKELHKSCVDRPRCYLGGVAAILSQLEPIVCIFKVVDPSGVKKTSSLLIVVLQQKIFS